MHAMIDALLNRSPLACLPLRLRALLLGWGSVGVVYSLSQMLQGQGIALPETALDRTIPFNPAGIWMYLSFFLLVPYAYFTVAEARLPWLMRSMQMCALFSGLVFVVWPTTLSYPTIVGDSVSEQILRLLHVVDSTQNCLPSLHGALTLLSVWALLDKRRWLRSSLAVLAGFCICYSIIQLRRHLSIDVAAGLATGAFFGWVATWRPLWRRKERSLTA